MSVKKSYNIGDSAWIYGLLNDRGENVLREGKVIKTFNIDYGNYDSTCQYYVVEIPSSIDPLLEVRVWENMSQDANGPVGGFREAVNDYQAAAKVMSRGGLTLANILPSKPKNTKRTNRRRKHVV